MKNCLYVLSNETTGRYYIGSTNNLERRLKEHQSGKTRTTKVLMTYKLVYKEEFDTIQAARLREKKIKSYKSKKYIDWLINQ
ncbi:MAG: Excinuclease ABC C subunit domain protein [Candidatus Gottesmanbacteria bacterium GW2011_GWA2_47_9]|uniref:Excinuclease ABC C subunit domain protein n=1 Tax=Candidatus Gottesmanbacteria bacterium GW2011_GWA2_47_9 TaxID=1618445 RepID=A0A0G1X1F3_9BACT|nr:MAG: Excinuclease ABC C subunit domain protein [Candidatus Gottesmanbacteria bacterium GW2011_GWA2_47_9]